MTRPDRFEDQLAALAAQMGSATQQAQDVELSEELLLQYYAGELSHEQAQQVARLAALSPSASAYLAQLELDAQEAAATTDRQRGWARLFHVVPGMAAVQELVTSAGRLRTLTLATGAMAAILALVIVVPPILQGPPDFGANLYVVGPGQGKSIETLPGGERVGDVAPDWLLHVPSGRVTELSWFVWQPVEGAQRYGLQVIDSEGGVVFTASPRDPHVKLPSSAKAKVPPGEECAWVVEALDEKGKTMVRGVGRFTLQD